MTTTVTEWHQYNRLVDDTPECGPVYEALGEALEQVYGLTVALHDTLKEVRRVCDSMREDMYAGGDLTRWDGASCDSPWADVPVLRARRADAITTAKALARLVADAGLPFSVDPEALLEDVADCAIRPRAGWTGWPA